jgi:hypothetical protein
MVASGLSRAKHTKFLWPSEKQGVEDFQNAFAQSRCAVEGKQFLAYPRPSVDFQNCARGAALIKQTTRANKKRSVHRAI